MIGTALAVASGAFNIYQQYANKPKKDDYIPKGGMYERYLNHLKSQSAESVVYHQAMRPELRQIGAQTQRGQRAVDYQVASQKPGGGVEAQMRMGINQQALSAIGLANERAFGAQERSNVRTGEQLMQIGIQEDQALQRYTRAKETWNRRMTATIGQTAVSVGSSVAKGVAAKNKLEVEKAKIAGESLEKRQIAYNDRVADGSIDSKKISFEQFDATAQASGMRGSEEARTSGYSDAIKTQFTKEQKFIEDEELEAKLSQSAKLTNQMIEQVNAGATNFDEMEAQNFEGMTAADEKKYYTAKQAQLKKMLPDPNKPLETEFTGALVSGKMKEMTGVASQIYSNPLASNPYKQATFKVVRAEQDRIIAQKERQLARADKTKTKALELEIKGLRADADKQTMMFLLGAESGANSTYKDGKGAEGAAALLNAQNMLDKVKFTGGGKGMGSNAATGMKRNIITWAQAIKWEDESILDAFANISIDDIDQGMTLGELPIAKSPSDKKSLVLVKEWMGRIDALYTQMPYDDTLELVSQTQIP